MSRAVTLILDSAQWFFLFYLLFYASYLLLSVVMGAWSLYRQEQRREIKNELKHQFYFPISLLVPAYNEEVTILDSVDSLLKLDYRLYEIIVVDDGSKDGTSQALIQHFHMRRVDRPIRLTLPCKPIEAVYEAPGSRVSLTLIRKGNGGKGDALNCGINAAQYPYFICMDADSSLQPDALERIIQPVMEDSNVVAVGGLVRAAQGIRTEGRRERLPLNPLAAMQILEYERSFLASRILLDGFNGNLIISGAFGLFKKDVVVAAGGYATDTLGEDMELVVKLHVYCRNNQRPYAIRYEPNAVCWSQAPASAGDLMKQRRRWHLGLFQCLVRYRFMFGSLRYGFVGTVSYLYYLLYELLSPFITVLGVGVTVLAAAVERLNYPFMIKFYLLFVLYGAILTITAFFQRIYTQNLRISRGDAARACLMCVFESVFFRFLLDFVRITAFIGYRKRKNKWGEIKRYQSP